MRVNMRKGILVIYFGNEQNRLRKEQNSLLPFVGIITC